MDIPTELKNDIAIVDIPVNELDASNVGDLKRSMAGILEKYHKVVIDLHRTQFVDSSGLGAILSFLRQVSGAGGDLKLCGLSRQVRATFELVRMHRIFEILDTREEAVRTFSSI